MQSVLNLEILDELVDIMGDDMQMLLNSYFEDSQIKLDALGAMDWQSEQQTIFRTAHALKGSSRNVGVIGFSDLCEKIELLARTNNLTQEEFKLDKLNQLFNQASDELKQRYL